MDWSIRFVLAAGLLACAFVAPPVQAAGGQAGFVDVEMTPFQFALGPPGIQVFSKKTHVRGMRLALLHGIQHDVSGLDLGIFLDADDVTGLQFGLGNQVFESMKGVQIGVANSNDHGTGLQIGLVNRTHGMKGLQIGLLNWNDEALIPVLPFFNFHF